MVAGKLVLYKPDQITISIDYTLEFSKAVSKYNSRCLDSYVIDSILAFSSISLLATVAIILYVYVS